MDYIAALDGQSNNFVHVGDIIDRQTGEVILQDGDSLQTRLSLLGRHNVHERRRVARDVRYTTLRLAQDAMTGKMTTKGNRFRVCDCQRLPVPDAGAVAVVQSPSSGNAAMRGLITCASVWACPVCSSKIALGRRDEVREALQAHLSDGGIAVSVTYTLKHGAGHSASELVDGLTQSLRRMRANRTIKTVNEMFTKSGQIRALEVTYGERNGWHPHIHEVWFLDTRLWSPDDVNIMQKLISTAWISSVKTAGLPAPDAKIGVVVKQIETARDYEGKGIASICGVTGWDAADELTRGMTKKAKLDRYGPFDLLIAGKAGLFADYVFSFAGKRQLTWSPGLKKRLGINEVSDEELAEEDAKNGVPVITIDRKSFIRAVGLSFSFVPELLTQVEKYGPDDAIIWLRKRGIDCSRVLPPD